LIVSAAMAASPRPKRPSSPGSGAAAAGPRYADGVETGGHQCAVIVETAMGVGDDLDATGATASSDAV